MSLLNYRDVRDHLALIDDAEFVGSELVQATGELTYSVRFYPWWEHPLYQAARQGGTPGRIDFPDEAKVIVTIIARRVREFRLSTRQNIEEWAFLEDHPLLWLYHDKAKVFCNSKLTEDQIIELIDLVRMAVGEEDNPYRYLNVPRSTKTFYQWAAGGSGFCVGNFPKPLFDRVIGYFDSISAELFLPHRPENRKDIPKILVIDDEDYIIADDFDLKVPPVEHKDEWFRSK